MSAETVWRTTLSDGSKTRHDWRRCGKNASFSVAGKRVFVNGHRGMVRPAMARRLAPEHCEALTAIAARSI
jgi:hypothetical protein